MKNQITQLSLLIVAFVALTFLMSYTHPAADEPKQYTVVVKLQTNASNLDKFEEEVNKKLAEGWHLQGGLAMGGQHDYYQAMVK